MTISPSRSNVVPNDPGGMRSVSRLAILCGLVVLSVCLHQRLLPYADDDAYIHFRVARNFWNTGAPYFNVLDPVMASTSPLWVVLLSPCALLGEHCVAFVGFLNSVLTVWAGVLWAHIFRNGVPQARQSHLVVAGVLVSLTLLPASIGLMETPAAMCAIALGFLGLMKRRWWGVVSLALAIFIRPEAIVYAFAAACIGWRQYGSASVRRGFVIAVALAGAFLFFEYHFFGTLLPHTAKAKQIVYQIRTGDFLPLLAIASYGSLSARYIVPLSVVLASLFGFLCIMTHQASPHSTARGALLRDFFARLLGRGDLAICIPLAGLLVITAYGVERVFVFPWYAPLYLIPGHLVAWSLWLGKRLWMRALSAALLLPLVATSAQVLAAGVSPGSLPSFEAGARARQLLLLGKILGTRYPQAKLLAPEIGALGYTFPGPVIDGVGLATPRALQYHPLSVPDQRPTGFHAGVPAAFVSAESPDIVVGLSTLMVDLERSSQRDRYEVLALQPALEEDMAYLPNGTVFGARHLLVFIRRELRGDLSTELLSAELQRAAAHPRFDPIR